MTARPSDSDAAARAEEAGIWCLRFSEGALTAEDQARYEAWSDADPRNRAAFDEALVIWMQLDSAKAFDELLSIRIKSLASYRRAKISRALRTLIGSWPRIVLAAACASILVTVGVVWAVFRPIVYETGIAERRVLILSDGSKLSLDAATRVDVSYSKGRRDLRLESGRAKFDVAKDPLRPFVVTAGNRIVVATGTEFSVELLPQEVHVILYEGQVSVLDRTGALVQHDAPNLEPMPKPSQVPGVTSVKPRPILTPGRELVASTETSASYVAPIDSAKSLLWEAGQLVFIDEPLSSAVERVNRYANDKIEVGDKEAGKIRVTGVFTAGDLTAFIEGITAVFPVRATMQDGHALLIYQPRSNAVTRSPT